MLRKHRFSLWMVLTLAAEIAFCLPAAAEPSPIQVDGESPDNPSDRCAGNPSKTCDGGANNGHGSLKGETTWAQVNGKIIEGKILRVSPDETLVFRQADGPVVRVPPDQMAISKKGDCFRYVSAFCVGAPSYRLLPDGKNAAGEIAGFFPDSGDLLLREGENLARFPSKDVSTEPPAQTKLVSILTAADLTHLGDGALLLPACGAGPTEQASSTLAFDNAKPLKDLLRTRSPKPDPEPRNPWLGCTNQDTFGRLLKADAQGNVLPECAPDTLYSWLPPSITDHLEKEMGKGPWQADISHNGRPLFLSRTPASTFGFGSKDEAGGMGLRFKLKPSVKFHNVGNNAYDFDCAKMPADEAAHTIYVRALGGQEGARKGGGRFSAEDFMLCSSGPVESWSFGTQEFHDELVRDVRYALDPAHKHDWPSYVWYSPTPTQTEDHELFDFNADLHPFTQTQLRNTLELQQAMATHGEGTVYANPDSPGAENRHFKTAVPTWFQDGL